MTNKLPPNAQITPKASQEEKKAIELTFAKMQKSSGRTRSAPKLIECIRFLKQMEDEGKLVLTTYPVDRSDTPWSSKAPHTKPERRRILKECGESCFLMPANLAFPICNKRLPCTYNCRGIKAASARAGEYKYSRVLTESKALSAQLNCYKTKKKA